MYQRLNEYMRTAKKSVLYVFLMLISLSLCSVVGCVAPGATSILKTLESHGVHVANLTLNRDRSSYSLSIETLEIDSLSVVEDMPLTFVSIANAPLIDDLSPLRNLPLDALCIMNSDIEDLSPLAGLNLKMLNLNGSKVTDLSPLSDMDLQWLDVGSSPVRDLAPLKGVPLRHLALRDTSVSDLSPLHGMVLKSLSFTDTRVVDLSPLAGIEVERIFFSPERIEKGFDVLARVKSLREINGKPVEQFLAVNGKF